MRRLLPIAAVLVAFALGVSVLALTEDDARRWGFRALVVLVGIVALRALARWHGSHPRPPVELRRPRRRWRRRRTVVTRHGTDRVVHLATVSAGDAHRGLRPLLQDVADERLRSRGRSLDDPDAATLVDAATWDLIRPDRPPPHDLRSPGLSLDAIDRVLTDLERI